MKKKEWIANNLSLGGLAKNTLKCKKRGSGLVFCLVTLTYAVRVDLIKDKRRAARKNKRGLWSD
ncbi:MAG: hypothetical protein ABIH47_02390 [Candidatus Omnitrophota bacterium]